MGRTLKGRGCKLYRNTATNEDGTPNEAAPVWRELTIVKDAKFQLAGQMADVTVRRHGKIKREETVHDEVSIEFDIRVPTDKVADTDYVALRDAKANHTPVEFAVCNRAINTVGTEIFRAVCELSDFGEEQPLGDAVKISITAKGTDSTLEPGFSTATGDEDVAGEEEEGGGGGA